MADLLASLIDGFRAALRRERLPSPPAQAPRAEERPGLLRLIFSRETLPLEPVVESPPRPGFFSHVFARERLDQGAPLPAPHRSPWLAWLFRAEHLDD
jgi:hypothetical protein